MADRPILFSAPMVRALLAGTKTQTRRVLKVPGIMGGRYPIYPPEEAIELAPDEFREGVFHYASTGALSGPYSIGFAVGDRLWVRENWHAARSLDATTPRNIPRDADIEHAATARSYAEIGLKGRLRPGIHMPRWASRLTLTVTDVRVERLQDISEADAIAEGVFRTRSPNAAGDGWEWDDPRDGYRNLWDSINGAGAWDANPWVVAVSFDVREGNIDA